MNVRPVATTLVFGATKSGVAGVLLSVCAPVSTCAVPCAPTANGSSNVRPAAVPTVFATCGRREC